LNRLAGIVGGRQGHQSGDSVRIGGHPFIGYGVGQIFLPDCLGQVTVFGAEIGVVVCTHACAAVQSSGALWPDRRYVDAAPARQLIMPGSRGLIGYERGAG